MKMPDEAFEHAVLARQLPRAGESRLIGKHSVEFSGSECFGDGVEFSGSECFGDGSRFAQIGAPPCRRD
jgi:hypothetical protein